MRSLFPPLFAALVLAVATLRGSDSAVFAAVRAADDARVAATIAADLARLDSLYSADLRYVHSSGKIDNKAEHLEGVARRTNAYEKFDYRSREFLAAGPGVVLMTGRVVIHSTTATGKNLNDVTFLAVWREEQGHWRLLAWQAGKNPPGGPGKK